MTTDAATFSEQCAYVFALIVRDSNGELIQAKSGSKQGTVSSDYAEALAIKEALSWIKLNH